MKTEEQLRILLEFGELISNEHNLVKLLNIMADYAKDLLQADRCSIFLYDEKNDELWTQVAHGTQEIRIPSTRGIVGYAALSKEIQVVVDAYNDFRFHRDIDLATGYKTKTIIAVPLVNAKDKVVGVFQALNKIGGLFSSLDVEFLMLISNFTGAAIENSLLYAKIKETQSKLIQKLSTAAEFKDDDTSRHTRRVGLYSALIARKYGLDEEEVNLLEQVAPMHDAGKLGIADNILKKPGKLDYEEFEIMKTHAMMGYKLLEDESDETLNAAAVIAREHHEKYDGSGYPRGLKGEQITLFGRITAITDVFDALTSRRAYKEPWSLEDSFALLERERGSHFDPHLVDIFMNSKEEVLEIYHSHKDL